MKLVCREGQDTTIQGIVHIGKIVFFGGPLRKSLLEAAPCNRKETESQRYRGVGRILVARLVVESFQQGGQGRVIVVPRKEIIPFYSKLRFTFSPFSKHEMILDVEPAQELLLRLIRHET